MALMNGKLDEMPVTYLSVRYAKRRSPAYRLVSGGIQRQQEARQSKRVIDPTRPSGGPAPASPRSLPACELVLPATSSWILLAEIEHSLFAPSPGYFLASVSATSM